MAKTIPRTIRALCVSTSLCLLVLVWSGKFDQVLAAPSPGIPQPGNIIWQEDFSRGTFTPTNPSSSTSPSSLMTWTDPSSSTTETGLPISYYAESRWARGAVKSASNCNAWILDSTSAMPDTSFTGDYCDVSIAKDTSGQPREAWWWARHLSYVLGTAQGMDVISAAANKSLVEMTTNDTNSGTLNQTMPSPVQFKTSGDLGVISGHFYQLSAWFAVPAATCSQHSAGSTDAQEAVFFTANSSRLDGGGITADPCAEGQKFTGAPALDGATTDFYARHYTSQALQIYDYVNPASVSVEVQNPITAIMGNDVAIDALALTDITPQLDQEFSPPQLSADGNSFVSRLTYTITNTSELLAKYGWTFTNTLPDGIRPIAGSFGQNCPAVWGWIGAQTVNVGGSLYDGQASCQAWVDVEITEGGGYLNTVANYDIIDYSGQKVSSLKGVRAPSIEAPLETASDPKLELAVSASTSTVNAAGENFIYTFTLKNTGDVALNNLALDYNSPWQSAPDAPGFSGDPTHLSNMTCSITPGLGLEKLTLLPGDAIECFMTYKTSQTDIDREGGVDLRAVLIAQVVATGAEVTSNAPAVHVAAGNLPSLELKILATRANTGKALDAPLEENEVINYAFVVTNKSLASVHDVALVGTSFNGASGQLSATCPKTSLAPFEIMTCQATYTVTPVDVNKTLLHMAYAQGWGTDEIVRSKVTSVTDSASLPASPQFGLVATKKHYPLPTNGDSGTLAGEKLTYIFTVANTSNVPLTDVTISDDEHNDASPDNLVAITPNCQSSLSNPLTLDLGTLAPGEVQVCEAQYTLTQADIDDGEVTSTTTVTGSANGAPVGDTDIDIFYPVTAPDITILNRTATASLGEPGDINYTYTLWNNGNVTLNDVALVDVGPQYGTGIMSAITCQWVNTAGVLLPDEKVNCMAIYHAPEEDIRAAAALVSTATVTASDPTNKIASDAFTATTNILAKGTISGRVHMDHNMNTFFNTDSEPGMADVTMKLIGQDLHGNAVELTTTTDYQGEYIFTDLLPGTYDVVEPQEPPNHISVYSSAGYYLVDAQNRPLPDDAKNGRGSDQVGAHATLADKNTVAGIVIDWGDYNQGNDFGETCGSLGNLVWMDTDRDGYADAGEPGIKGVEMALYFDKNDDGLVEDNELTRTMLTDEDGHYYFSELDLTYQDGYFVKVTDGNGVLLALDMQPTYTATEVDFKTDNCSSHQRDSLIYAETRIDLANNDEPEGWFDWMKDTPLTRKLLKNSPAPYAQIVALAATAPNIGLVSLNSNLTADYGFMTATNNANTTTTSTNNNSNTAASASTLSSVCGTPSPGARAPYIYEAQKNSDNSVTLSFLVGDEPFTKYLLRYGLTGGMYTFGTTIANPRDAQITINHLQPNQTYQFQLIPMNDCQSGPYSNVFSVSLSQLPRAPGVPNTGSAPLAY